MSQHTIVDAKIEVHPGDVSLPQSGYPFPVLVVYTDMTTAGLVVVYAVTVCEPIAPSFRDYLGNHEERPYQRRSGAAW